eukprot:1156499-Pelagomonas_calceolata.AAC.14
MARCCQASLFPQEAFPGTISVKHVPVHGAMPPSLSIPTRGLSWHTTRATMPPNTTEATILLWHRVTLVLLLVPQKPPEEQAP